MGHEGRVVGLSVAHLHTLTHLRVLVCLTVALWAHLLLLLLDL